MGAAVPGAEVRQAAGGEKCGGQRGSAAAALARCARRRSLDVDAEQRDYGRMRPTRDWDWGIGE
jgi:hypothetical protein